MLDQWVAWVSKWGYLGVFLGSLVEGESIILVASFLAARGDLLLYYVMLVAFIGTVIADQALFYVGRRWGEQILLRYPRLNARAERAFRFLEKYNTAYILSFRFIYGIRIISPIVIGISHIPSKRFAFLNIVAAAIWTLISCSVGYFFGDIILHSFDSTQRAIVISLALIVVAALFARRTVVPWLAKRHALKKRKKKGKSL